MGYTKELYRKLCTKEEVDDMRFQDIEARLKQLEAAICTDETAQDGWVHAMLSSLSDMQKQLDRIESKKTVHMYIHGGQVHDANELAKLVERKMSDHDRRYQNRVI